MDGVGVGAIWSWSNLDECLKCRGQPVGRLVSPSPFLAAGLRLRADQPAGDRHDHRPVVWDADQGGRLDLGRRLDGLRAPAVLLSQPLADGQAGGLPGVDRRDGGLCRRQADRHQRAGERRGLECIVDSRL